MRQAPFSRKLRSIAAFTLMEVGIAIGIVAIGATIVVLAYQGYRSWGKAGVDSTDLNTLNQAVEIVRWEDPNNAALIGNNDSAHHAAVLAAIRSSRNGHLKNYVFSPGSLTSTGSGSSFRFTSYASGSAAIAIVDNGETTPPPDGSAAIDLNEVVLNARHLSAFVGNTSNSLDGVVTAELPLGRRLVMGVNGQQFLYELTAGTAGTSEPDVVRPSDFSVTTNPKVWVLRRFYNTMAGANNLSEITDPAQARTSLALGSLATQNANAADITGGTAALDQGGLQVGTQIATGADGSVSVGGGVNGAGESMFKILPGDSTVGSGISLVGPAGGIDYTFRSTGAQSTLGAGYLSLYNATNGADLLVVAPDGSFHIPNNLRVASLTVDGVIDLPPGAVTVNGQELEDVFVLKAGDTMTGDLTTSGIIDGQGGVRVNGVDVVPETRSIQAGAGLTGGGDLSSDRTLSLVASGVAPGTYGSSTQVPVVTTDEYGRITGISLQSVTPAGVGAVDDSATIGFATTNGVVISPSSALLANSPTFTISTPQDIRTTASPTFVGLKTTGLLDATVLATDASGNLVNGAAILNNYLPKSGGALTGALTGTSASFSGNVSGSTLTSTVATGTAPLTVTSTTAVTNLNADLLDGNHGAFYQNAGNLNAGTLLAARLPAFTGDATSTAGTSALTLANSGVTAGSYGSASSVGTFTVDAKGRLTAAASTPIQIAESQVTGLAGKYLPLAGGTLTGALSGTTGSFSGNVTGSTLTSTVATGTAPLTITSTTAVTNLNADLLDGNHGSFYQNAANLNAGTLLAARLPAFTGDATSTAGTSALTLANSGVTAGSYGSASSVSTFTVDAKGRLTAAGATPISIAESQVSGLPGKYVPLAGGSMTGTLNAPRVAATATGAAVGSAAFEAVGAQGFTSALILGQANVINWRLQNTATTGTFAINDGATDRFSVTTSGNVAFTGTLTGGTVPWARLSNAPTVTAGTGLAGGGALTGGITLSLSTSGVTAGTYGSSTQVPVVTTDQYGRITGISTQTVTAAGVGAIDDSATISFSSTNGVTISPSSATLASSPSFVIATPQDLRSTASPTFAGLTAGGNVSGSTLTSTVANGTAPLAVTSSTLVTNLNADLLDGQHGSYYQNASNLNAGTLLAARLPAFTGDATSTAGTSALTLANSGVTAGTYTKVTVDAKGRVTTGASIGSSDVVSALGYTPVSRDATYLGNVGNVAFDASTNTAAAWANLPVGYSRMISSTVGTAGGAPINNFGYFTKTANRDTQGGWGGLWVGYAAGENFIGRASTNASFATWERIFTTSYLPTGVQNGAISNAMLANMAANTLKGNNTGSAGAPIDLTPAQVKALLAITTADVSGIDNYLPLSGGTLTGALNGTTATFSGVVTGSGFKATGLLGATLIGTDANGNLVDASASMGSANDARYVLKAGDTMTGALNGTSASFSGNVSGSTLTSTVATGTAPLTVASSTVVDNLNADLLDGYTGVYYRNASNLYTGTLAAARLPAFTGDATSTAGTSALTLVNSGVTAGSYGSASSVGTFTVDAKGRLTDAASTPIQIAESQVTGLAGKYLPLAGGTLTGALSGTTGSFSGNVTGSTLTSTVATGTAPLTVTSTTAVTNLNADLLDGQHGSYYQNAGNLNAGTLLAARLPAFTGDATSTAGTSALTLANSGVTAGTYSKVTVDAKGRVTTGANIGSSDVVSALGYTPVNRAGDTMSGELVSNTGTANQLRVISPSGTQSLWVRTGYDTDGSGVPASSPLNVMFQSSGSSTGSFTFVAGNTRVLSIGGSGLAINGSTTFSGAGIFGASGSARVQINAGGGTHALAEYWSTEGNPRWQLGRDAIAGGQSGLLFGTGGTMASSGAGIGWASSGTLGVYTSNGTSLVQRATFNTAGLTVAGLVSGTGLRATGLTNASYLGTDANGNLVAVADTLGNYVLKTGDTMTGPLNGTSATFSGAVSTGALSATTGTFSGGLVLNELTSIAWKQGAATLNIIEKYSGGLRLADPSVMTAAGHTFPTFDFRNWSTTGFNHINIADPGAGEGMNWSGTAAGWLIDVSPLNRSNNDGNFNIYGTANNIALWRPQMLVFNSTTFATLTAQADGGIAMTSSGAGGLSVSNAIVAGGVVTGSGLKATGLLNAPFVGTDASGNLVAVANTLGDYVLKAGDTMTGTLNGTNAIFTGDVTGSTLTSTVATGTAPLVVASTTAVTNLNADLLDGQHGSYYQNAANLNAGTLLAARLPAFTGDATSTAGTSALTLANSGVTAGSYGSASSVSTFTVDAKGRLTAAGSTAIAIAESQVSGLVGKYLPLAGGAMTGNLSFSGDRLLDVGQRTRINFSYSTLQTVDSGSDRAGWLWNAYYDWASTSYKFQNTNAQGASMLHLSPSGLSLYRKAGPSTAGATFTWDSISALVHEGGSYSNPAWITSLDASKLSGTVAAARLPAFSGDATSTAGTSVLTLANSGVAAGTYTKVTVDAKGRVTSGANIGVSEITAALGYTPVNKAGDSMTGNLDIASNRQLSIGGQTANGRSIYTWDGSAYRNPGTYTPALLVRQDNATTGSANMAPGLIIYNDNGDQNVTSGLVFASRETTGAGNSVPLAGLMGLKTTTGTAGGWSSGSLILFTKNQGAKVDVMTFAPNGDATMVGRLAISTGQADALSVTQTAGTYPIARFTYNSASAYSVLYINNSGSTASTVVIGSGGGSVGNTNYANRAVFGTTNNAEVAIIQNDAARAVFNSSGMTVAGTASASTLTSTVATGTAPLTVTSTTAVTNLNADLLDGQHGSYYQNAGNLNAGTLLAARLPAFTGDATSTAGTSALTLANSGVTAGSYGSASSVGTFTVDAKGRLTAAGSTAIAIAESQVSGLTGKYLPLAGGTMTGTIRTLGTSIVINRDATWTGGWARGLHFVDPTGATTEAAIGFLGTANNTPETIYLGFGSSPWGGTTGLYIRTSGVTSSYTVIAPGFRNTGLLSAPLVGTDASGNYARVNTLPTSTLPAFSGDVTSSSGSSTLTLANSGVTAGTYTKVTVDAKGRVTSGASIGLSEISAALGYTPVNKTGDTMTGGLKIALATGTGSGSHLWIDTSTAIANGSGGNVGQVQFSPVAGTPGYVGIGRRQSATVTNAGSLLGELTFNGTGTDQATWSKGASILAYAQAGSWGNSVGALKTDLAFSVHNGTAMTEMLRLGNNNLVTVKVPLAIAISPVMGGGGTPLNTSLEILSGTDNLLTFSNTADTASWAGTLFNDNFVAGYVAYRHSNDDRLYLGAINGIRLQVDNNVALGGKTTIVDVNNAGATINGNLTVTGSLIGGISSGQVTSGLGYVPTRAVGSLTNSVFSLDNRDVDDQPSSRNAGLFVDFKRNSTTSLADGGSYHGVLTFRPYGGANDFTAGYPIQLGFTNNGNLWTRMGASGTTWGAWTKVLTQANLSSADIVNALGFTPVSGGSYLPLAGGTLTGGLTGTTGNFTSTFTAGGVFTATGGAKISVQESVDGGNSRGIFMWNETDTNWGIYMSQAGAGKSLSGGAATAGLDGRTSHAIRFRVNNAATQIGFLWENSAEVALMQLQPDTGNLYVKGLITGRTGLTVPTGAVSANFNYPTIHVGNSTGQWAGYAITGNNGTMVMHYGGQGQEVRFGRYNTNFGTFVSNPVVFDLASGAATFNGRVTAQGFTSTSSIRWKENVQPLAGALETIRALRPVTYDWKRSYRPEGGHEIGFIAEEVGETIPEIVGRDADGRPNSVDYSRVTPALVGAVQDLDRGAKDEAEARAAADRDILNKVAALSTAVESVRAENASLRREIATLKSTKRHNLPDLGVLLLLANTGVIVWLLLRRSRRQ